MKRGKKRFEERQRRNLNRINISSQIIITNEKILELAERIKPFQNFNICVILINIQRCLISKLLEIYYLKNIMTHDCFQNCPKFLLIIISLNNFLWKYWLYTCPVIGCEVSKKKKIKIKIKIKNP